jgi:hypothetical protein
VTIDYAALRWGTSEDYVRRVVFHRCFVAEGEPLDLGPHETTKRVDYAKEERGFWVIVQQEFLTSRNSGERRPL